MEEIGQNLNRIEQVDQIARLTLARHQEKMPEKYANIQATLKLLTNLIAGFHKRALQTEQELKKRAKIKDLDEQIQFHRQRIQDCQRMSEALSSKVEEKRSKISQEERTVSQLRTQLLKLKTQNVKKVLLLQNLEAEKKSQQNKENTEMRKTTWKMKTQFSRAFHTNYDTFDNEVSSEKKKTVKALYSCLNKKKAVDCFMGQAWQLTKEKLYRLEKKANLHGLHGSLVFKMIENDHPCPPKSLGDPKLMIYDVLKAKHRNQKREEKRGAYDVSKDEFMKMSPLQIFGLVELKGGLAKLQESILHLEGKNGRNTAFDSNL